MPTKLEK
jgi:hypothetical protein